jgi:hypothetical protein
VSLVSVCSAAKLVVMVRWSIHGHVVEQWHDPEEPGAAQSVKSPESQDDGAFPLHRDPRRLHEHETDESHRNQRNGIASGPHPSKPTSSAARSTPIATTLTRGSPPRDESSERRPSCTATI